MTRKTPKICDELIVKYYNIGWSDSADGKKEKVFKNSVLQTAYNFGWTDFIVGDDVSSVDLQTEPEILKKIKYSCKYQRKC